MNVTNRAKLFWPDEGSTRMEDESGEPKRGFLLHDASPVLYLANLACIPLHILAARVPKLQQADVTGAVAKIAGLLRPA